LLFKKLKKIIITVIENHVLISKIKFKKKILSNKIKTDNFIKDLLS